MRQYERELRDEIAPALIFLAALLATVLLISQALAHEDADWIRQGDFRNAIGDVRTK